MKKQGTAYYYACLFNCMSNMKKSWKIIHWNYENIEGDGKSLSNDVYIRNIIIGD